MYIIFYFLMIFGFLGMAITHSNPRIELAIIFLVIANALFLWK